MVTCYKIHNEASVGQIYLIRSLACPYRFAAQPSPDLMFGWSLNFTLTSRRRFLSGMHEDTFVLNPLVYGKMSQKLKNSLLTRPRKLWFGWGADGGWAADLSFKFPCAEARRLLTIFNRKSVQLFWGRWCLLFSFETQH